LGHRYIRSHITYCYRIVKIWAGNQTRTAADPQPDDLRNALIKNPR
jgi:hypothetical protein